MNRPDMYEIPGSLDRLGCPSGLCITMAFRSFYVLLFELNLLAGH
jgi:hypothetical protein